MTRDLDTTTVATAMNKARDNESSINAEETAEMPSIHSLRRIGAVIVIVVLAASTLALPALGADPTPAPGQLGTPAPPFPGGPVPTQFPVTVTGDTGRISFTVSPLTIETDFATKTGNFRVDNHSKYESSFKVVCFTYTINEAGTNTIIPDPTNVAGWFRFTEPEFVLQPGTGTTIPFSVVVPPDATPGDHFVGVQITGQATDKAVASMPSTSGGFQLRTPAAVQVLIVDRVPGQLTSKITASMSAPSFSFITSRSFDFVTKIHDDGNTAVLLSGGTPPGYADRQTPTLTLSGGIPFLNPDTTIYATNSAGVPTDFRLLPGTGRTSVINWDSIPLIAHYDYTFTIPGSSADNRQPVTVRGSFWVVNVIDLIVIVLVLVVLITLLAFWRWRSIHGRAAKTTKLAVAASAKRRQIERERAKAAEPKGEVLPKDTPKGSAAPADDVPPPVAVAPSPKPSPKPQRRRPPK